MAKHTPYWFAAIKEAKRRQNDVLIPFPEPIRKKANKWVTCACGKQDRRIPRSSEATFFAGKGEPLDSLLSELGYQFNLDVRRQSPDAALATLLKIEQRSAEILAELDKR